MSRDSDRTVAELQKGEIAASAACTKSGAFALALCLVLFLLVPYWYQRPSEEALAQYVTYRMLLNMNFDQLDRNPIWQKSLLSGYKVNRFS
jgi:hypothetical protein